ncbi:MAG: homocysteine S-methyltransferase family protein [Acidimicrobiia bacterium]
MTNRTRTPFPSPDTVVVTDAGLETWLVFDRGVDLPAFAAYPLAATADGQALLTDYYEHYVAIADNVGAACLLEAPTWRANPDWAATLGHDRAQLSELIDAAVAVPDALRRTWTSGQPFLVGGAVGPRGDGYRIDDAMTPGVAAEYHAFQIGCLATTPADVVTAMTMCYADEAIGIVQAARDQEMPVVVSFTVETDGRLPSGMSLGDAIETTDAATDGYATHYMLNCAHPAHFDTVLDPTAAWANRLRGLRANASMLSHAELDEMEVLDAGDPADLASRYSALAESLPSLHVVGGCCGTDHRHVAAIAQAFGSARPVS